MSAPDGADGSDGSDRPHEGPDGGPSGDGGSSDGGGTDGGAPGEPRKRRRRRRGGGGASAGSGEPQGQDPSTGGTSDGPGEPGADPQNPQQPRPPRQPQQQQRQPQQQRDPQQRDPQQQRQPQQQRGPQQGRGDHRGGGPQGGQQNRGSDNRGGPQGGQQNRGSDNRGGGQQQNRGSDNRGGGQQQSRGGDNRGGGGGPQQNRGGGGGPQQNRGGDNRGGRRSEGRDGGRDQGAGGEADLRSDDDDTLTGDPYRSGGDDQSGATRAREPSRQAPVPGDTHKGEDDEAPAAPSSSWGSDDDTAAAPIVLASDLPTDAPADDPDPLTWPLVSGPGAALGDDVASVVGVRFVPAGRIQWCDAGDSELAPGDRVIVDSERGQRLAWVATAPSRKATRDRGLRRVIRRANEMDLRADQTGDADRIHALRIAKDKAAALKLPIKIFRVEKASGKLTVYYTSEDERARLDVRDFVRDVSQATGLRLELRQLGVRDEAKAVGGIGSCGLTLCCTTWLPDFVPVSIKMAKDQGLVLSPTKVSGQCGRLKCCLVYEQAGYAELRKGLPKLGKRVISAKGEGRVVEVDVLRQRVRVSYGAGDTEVLPATEVKPMFPPGNQSRAPGAAHDPDSEHEADADEPDLPSS